MPGTSIARRLALLSLGVWLASSPAFAIHGAVRRSRAPTNLTALSHAIRAALDVPGLESGFVGIEIANVSTGRELYSRNANRLFLPASNMKLFTAAAALALLGPEFVYRTQVYATGILNVDGVLCGDLTLKGSGDPLLSDQDLAALGRQVREAGILRVQGRLLYDDSCFDRRWLGDGWSWDDETAYYSAQISGLNVDENVESVTVSPGGKPGRPLRVEIAPLNHYLRVENAGVSAKRGSRRSLVVDRKRGLNVVTIRGRLPVGLPGADDPVVPVTVEDPARYAAGVFAQALARAGVEVGRPQPGTAGAGCRVIAEHNSRPLSDYLPLMLKPSDNLMAECLLKTIGAAKSGVGTGGEDGTGAAAARDWYRSVDLNLAELVQVDGSGLSRFDCVSPSNLVRLLLYLHARPDFQIIYSALPIAGVDGTLRRRMKGTAAAENCHAKTGSLRRVSTLSGYVMDRTGEMLTFSILMNNQSGGAAHAAQDRIVEALAELGAPTVRSSGRAPATSPLPAAASPSAGHNR